MGLIELGTVSAVAIIGGIRSERWINKLIVLCVWGVYAAFSLGWSL